MDPITILGLVSTCTTIASRVASLVESLPRVVASYRDVERSILRLGNQLGLFQGSVDELRQYLQRSARLSARVKTTLSASLGSCADIVEDMQRHVRKVTGGEGAAAADVGVIGRARHVWDETFVNQCEQRVLAQMQMMDIYIRMVQLNDAEKQESILDGDSATTLIGKGNDDARTIRSEWEADGSFLDNSAVGVRSSRQAYQVPGNRRRSVASILRGLATTKGGRQSFARKLVQACENRNMTAIQALIQQGGSPNWTDDCLRLPLVAAVKTGQYTIVKALLDSGAKVNAQQYWVSLSDAPPGSTDPYKPIFVNALFEAVRSRNTALTRFLIAQGADVTCDFSLKGGGTVLFLAIAAGDADIVSAVLEAGADSEVNMQRWSNGSTPLIAAILTGNLAVVKVLLEYGSDPNLMTSWPGEAVPPLCLAIDPTNGRQQAAPLVVDLAKALLERGSDVRQTGSGWWLVRTPTKQTETMRVKGITAAHVAAITGGHETLEMILSHGGDPNAYLSADDVTTTSYNWKEHEYQKLSTPLHDAKDGRTVDILLRHGAALNERLSCSRQTPLGVAKTRQKESAVEALVRAGATE